MQATTTAVLTGGASAVRFLEGATDVVPPEGITGNGKGGGDLGHRGLRLSTVHR